MKIPSQHRANNMPPHPVQASQSAWSIPSLKALEEIKLFTSQYSDTAAF